MAEAFDWRITRGVAERQQAEARLQELQSELAHVGRVNEMGQMASALAHELNQPLGATLTYLQAVQRLLQMSGGGQDRQGCRPGDPDKRDHHSPSRVRGQGGDGASHRGLAKVVEEATACRR